MSGLRNMPFETEKVVEMIRKCTFTLETKGSTNTVGTKRSLVEDAAFTPGLEANICLHGNPNKKSN